MPNQPFQLTPIGSYMPSQDVRNITETRVIDGKNFLFDSFGPKSGFASRQLSPFPVGAPLDVQGIRLQGRTFVFSQDAIMLWRSKVPFMWDLLFTFDSSIPLAERDPWSAIYIGGNIMLSQRNRGVLMAEYVPDTERLWLHPQTNSTIPGLIEGIRAMDVVRNRAILVNDTTIQWSDLGDCTDLTPAEAGPGFVLISDFSKGTFLSLVSFNEGFVVYTTEGSIVCEYIGGDATWRFYAGTSSERPVNPWTTVRLSNGGTIFLSRRGLMSATNGREPTAWTPEFNEFFREYTTRMGFDETRYRLEYDADRESMYVMESSDGSRYWRAWQIRPTLDKWGMFNEQFYGILPITNGLYGYVDINGVVNYFTEFTSRGTEPDNALGYNRHYPRIEKQLDIPSTSAVSRASAWNVEFPLENPEVPAADWYGPGSTTPAPQGLRGMDSWISIGFARSPQMIDAAESRIEFHELLIGSVRSAPPEVEDFTTAWKPDYFYGTAEDWDSPGEAVDGDLIEDLDIVNGSIDFESAPSYGAIDMEYANYPTYYFDVESVEDWNNDGIAEDWGGVLSGLNEITYQLTVESSEDGITFDETTPFVARFMTEARLFTLMSSGTYHRFTFRAIELGEYYHIKLMTGTIDYGGKVI